MAKQLGLGVVAEGVETAEQLEWLERIGCDEVQGYYFSRALDARELPEWGRLRAEQRRLRPTVRPLKVA
jgi:EAL domain-containing protein (putative c-di-GMP-specific phosphodiesterase class I)